MESGERSPDEDHRSSEPQPPSRIVPEAPPSDSPPGNASSADTDAPPTQPPIHIVPEAPPSGSPPRHASFVDTDAPSTQPPIHIVPEAPPSGSPPRPASFADTDESPIEPPRRLVPESPPSDRPPRHASFDDTDAPPIDIPSALREPDSPVTGAPMDISGSQTTDKTPVLFPSSRDSQGSLCSQGSHGSQGSQPSKSSVSNSAGIIPVVFQLQRMTLYNLKFIDDINQQFQAHVYFEFVIPDGQKNDELTAGAGDAKTPPFKSAQWYWQLQLEIANACRFDVRERKIRMSKINDDIVCCLRIDGVFFANLNLFDFPIDRQEIRFHLEFLCSKYGPSPVEVLLPDVSPSPSSPSSNYSDETSVPISATPNVHTSSVTKSWDINPKVRYRTVENIFDDGGYARKVYPGVMCSIRIARVDTLFSVSLLAPMACLSMFSIVTFFFSDLTLRVTMGVSLISASVPQFVRVQMFMPKVQYVTRLQAFMLANGVLMLFVVFINSSITAISDKGDILSSDLDLTDSLLPQAICAGLWIILHGYAVRSILLLRRARESWIHGKHT